ncbi:MAG: hypothetical protein A4S09_16530 [Proteobacteria bacterium SG_bin7]|nr:MAG: hypothetical protein A4S09_16530 [Proteobacteria bacterium SG_bin7]
MLLRSPFRFYIRKNWRPFALGLFCLLVTNTLDCLLPLLLKEVIDALSSKKNFSLIYQPLAIYLGLVCFVAIFRFGWRWAWSRYHQSVAEDLRNRVFDKYTSLGLSFFNRYPVGQLMSLITNDINTFRMGVGPAVLLFFDATFYCGIIIPAMIYLSPTWTWKTLVALPLLPFFVAKLENLIQARYNLRQEKFSELSGIAQEIVSGVRIIKGYALETEHTKNFNNVSREFESASNKASYAQAALEPVMQFVVSTGVVILFFVGSLDVVKGTATIGTFVAFLRYVQKLSWPMSEIGFGMSMLLEARASFARVKNVLVEPSDIPDEGTVDPIEFQSLEVRSLTFSYSEQREPALKNISLVINRGEKIGFFGPIGSGKTSLVNLFCRLYESKHGSLLINGHPIQNIKQSSLHRIFCLVPQNVFLFGDTIAYNFALGLESPPETDEIEIYSKRVRLHDEILATKNGYETLLGEKGVNLSGGQKQRLTIARGLIRNAPVLILDDVLSAVDAETEKAIIDTLEGSVLSDKKQTVIVVSHRITSLVNCDRIYVFDNGSIQAVGNHSELLTASGFYRSIYQMQMTEAIQ